MGNNLDDNTSYIYQERPTKKTLRELKRTVPKNEIAQGSTTLQWKTMCNQQIVTNTEQVKSFDETCVGLNISVPIMYGNNSYPVYDVKNEFSSASTFTPGLASTPIKQFRLASDITSAPSSSGTDIQQQFQINLVQMDSNSLTDIKKDVDFKQIQDMIIQQTLSNGCNYAEPNSEFVPIATIDNIKVDKVLTENVFEVPNTMIAYLFDEKTQDVHPMRLVQMDEDISTYELIQQKQPDEVRPTLTAATYADQSPDKIKPKKSIQRKYRKSTLNWKNIRHLLPHRPIKPTNAQGDVELASNMKTGIIPARKPRRKYNTDEDYKPPSKLQINKGIAKHIEKIFEPN